ncbi:WD40-repeat-containing subunit of the 18S rRNA processing complex [Phaffia rhodozyma]|uniref:WD40-repeat-containing subunit of the 18S rRNA processing complex n=1 Tax=Phaffia rhodozyma TaxID=264483 RepID=A0A0F7ST60_PHARH|nr:WD40-repeat-containing subunit of the 18S rRNA processing complex [Phaffia rhodozyma]
MDTRPLSKPGFKTSYRSSRLISPLHTQGPVLLTADGLRMISTTGEDILLTEVESGQKLARVQGDTTDITSMSISRTGILAVFTRSLTLRLYDLNQPFTPPPAHLPHLPPSLPLLRQTARSHPSPILVSAMDPTSTLLASGSADGIVKVWDLTGGYVTHLFRSHGGPVSALAFNIPRSGPAKGRRMELITGCGDTKVRVFDLSESSSNGGRPRAVLDGHVSVVRGLGVSPDGRWLVSGGRDKVVLVWDLWGGADDGWERLFMKGSAAKKGKGKALDVQLVRTITVLESIESVGVISEDTIVKGLNGPVGDKLICWTAGEKGVVKLWDAQMGTEVGVLKGAEGVDLVDGSIEAEEGEQRGIVDVLFNSTLSALISVHSDQNILFHSLSTSRITRQLIGFNDEIIDSLFLSPNPAERDTHLALATNSSLIRVYSTKTFDARLLAGHSDMVLCLDKSKDGQWLVSGSKDRTARIWAWVPSPSSATGGNDEGEWRCVAVCEGHAESIGAVAFSRKPSDQATDSSGKAKFLFTASQDRTIKMWDLSALDTSIHGSSSSTPESSGEVYKPRSILTQKIHDKDINSLDLAPNDRLLASGSQDKTVKIFQVEYAAPKKGTDAKATGGVHQVGTCKGHKRGVWSVRFSRTDRVLATGSGDKTVRIWSLDDYTCLKTFEGHSNSVLRVDFLSQGQQLVSSSSDGLVKLWNVKDEECVSSFDNHEDKVWALAVSEDESTIVSGAADSVVTFWTDCTKADEEEKIQAKEKEIVNEQNFHNYVALKDYKNAILLALSMSQPGRLFKLFSTVRSSRPPAPPTASLLTSSSSSFTSMQSSDALSITGSAAVDQVLKTLPPLELVKLLGHIRDWNARAKTSPVAQTVLHAIFRLRPMDDIVQSFSKASAQTATALAAATANQPNDEDEDEDDKKPAKTKKPTVGPKVTLDLGEMIAGLVPYTERYFDRAERMVQESFVLDFALSEMDGGLFFGGGADDELARLLEGVGEEEVEVNELRSAKVSNGDVDME